MASHWKVTVLPTPTTWFRGLTTNTGGTGGQPRKRSAGQQTLRARADLVTKLLETLNARKSD